MAVFGSITQEQIAGNAQARLVNLKNAFEAVSDFYQWLSAYSQSDLEAVGFSPADASALLSAFADANEEYVLRNGGGLGSYTLPYNFSASQRVIIGPAT